MINWAEMRQTRPFLSLISPTWPSLITCLFGASIILAAQIWHRGALLGVFRIGPHGGIHVQAVENNVVLHFIDSLTSVRHAFALLVSAIFGLGLYVLFQLIYTAAGNTNKQFNFRVSKNAVRSICHTTSVRRVIKLGIVLSWILYFRLFALIAILTAIFTGDGLNPKEESLPVSFVVENIFIVFVILVIGMHFNVVFARLLALRPRRLKNE